MTKRTRRNHSPDFQGEVALAAMKGDRRSLSYRISSAYTSARSRVEGAIAGRTANVFGQVPARPLPLRQSM